jgi:hypothetical protein
MRARWAASFRYGAMFGIVAVVISFAARIARATQQTAWGGSEICYPDSIRQAVVIIELIGFAIFVLLAAASGWATRRRAGLPISLGALAGLVTAGVAGLATLALLTFDLNDVVLLSRCSGSSDPASFGGIRALATFSAVISVLIGLGIGAGAGAIGAIIADRKSARLWGDLRPSKSVRAPGGV